MQSRMVLVMVLASGCLLPRHGLADSAAGTSASDTCAESCWGGSPAGDVASLAVAGAAIGVASIAVIYRVLANSR
jgi:hypothetical protein